MPIRFSLRAANGQDYPISGPFRIGRGPECQIQVDNNLVSRIHASIWLDHDHLLLRDERSRNGTQLNGQPLAPGEANYLHHDDQVRVGQMVFTVVSDPPYPRPRQHRGLPAQPEDEPPPTARVIPASPGAAPPPQATAQPAEPLPGLAGPAGAPKRSLALPLIIGGCLMLLLLAACCLLGFVLFANLRPTLNPLNPTQSSTGAFAGGSRLVLHRNNYLVGQPGGSSRATVLVGTGLRVRAQSGHVTRDESNWQVSCVETCRARAKRDHSGSTRDA